MTDDRLVDDRPIGTDLARALYDLLTGKFELRKRDRVVIGIGGESGSGKSSAATSLARELRESGVRTCVINSDDYFHLPPRTNHEQRLRSLRHVGPHEVNLPLVEQHIRDFLAARNNVIAPQVNYPADRFDAQRHDFDTFQALIVEGTYVLGLEGLDVRIFLEATHEDTSERRRRRNRDIEAPIINDILAIEHDLIAPYSALANIVVDRNFTIRRHA